MAFEIPTTIVNGAVITASGVTPTFNATDAKTLDIELIASAVSGTTPSLTVALQWSMDGTNFAGSVALGSAITAVSNQIVSVAVEAPFYRFAYTVSGTTPSITLAAKVYEY